MHCRKMLAFSPQKVKNIPAGKLPLKDLLPQNKDILEELGITAHAESSVLEYKKPAGTNAA